jgi:hypothetical protein
MLWSLIKSARDHLPLPFTENNRIPQLVPAKTATVKGVEESD